MQTIINYDLPRKIEIGNVFYTIEETCNSRYYEKCKICDDKGTVTLKGITFKCPYCDSYEYRRESVFSIKRYKVTRWRIFSISQICTTDYWKVPTERNLEIGLYTKKDRCCGNRRTQKTNFYKLKNYLNLPFEKFEEVRNGFYNREIDYFIYDDYKLVCLVADKLNEVEEEKVVRHNQEFGTTYELPPKPKYDPKSN